MAGPIIKIKAKAKAGDGKRRTIINLWENDKGGLDVQLVSKEKGGFNADYDMDFVEFAKKRGDFYLDAYYRDDSRKGGGQRRKPEAEEAAGDFD